MNIFLLWVTIHVMTTGPSFTTVDIIPMQSIALCKKRKKELLKLSNDHIQLLCVKGE